jgi:hypothetical protein
MASASLPAWEDTIPFPGEEPDDCTPPPKKARTLGTESQEKEKEKEKEESPKTPEPPPSPTPTLPFPEEEEEEEVLGPDEEICMNEGCGERKSVHTQVCKRCIAGWSKRLFGWD